jgi:Amt family ammonium transporter
MIWHQTDYWKLFWCKDFAGGTVVHMSAGFAALAGVLVLGKEKTLNTFLPIFRLCFWEPECFGLAGLALMLVRLWQQMQRQQWLCYNNYCFSIGNANRCFDRIKWKRVFRHGACIGAVVVW